MPLLFPQTRALLLGAVAVFILFAFFLTDAFGPSHTHSPRDYLAQQQQQQQSSPRWHSTASKSRWRELTDPWAGRKDPTKILLASVLYDDQQESNELLERALLTHEKHAERWGYATAVLRKKLVDGWWGKWAWLQALVTMELNKDTEDAAEWIMFLSPTAVLSDPTIPLSLFLPPTTLTTNLTSARTPGALPRPVALNDIHFLGAYDAASPATANPDFPAVCAAAFFLRVHPWTASFLQHLLAAPLLPDPNPDAHVVDEDFALAKTLADVAAFGVGAGDAYDPAAFAHVVLQPERCGRTDGDDAVQVVPTALVTARTASAKNNYTRPDPNVDGAGPAEAWDFWEAIARARAVLREAEEVHERWGSVDDRDSAGRDEDDLASQTLAEGVARLKAAVSWGAGRKAVMREAVDAVRGSIIWVAICG
ncbi:hypothetical protein UCDDS831_g04796 [Diplodia seriata]|uniref:Uncharacterized protein n=1 Tax=Diplodia seriata TaxID=420778 RepID=A0A0G2ED89_9PEZI|nr:hypothetical protein UCDDS831_g04796 [Diplodia seriata]